MRARLLILNERFIIRSPVGIELLIIILLFCMMAWAGFVINFCVKNERDNVHQTNFELKVSRTS